MRKNFLSLMIWACLVMATACKKTFVEVPESDPVSVFEHFWSTMNKEYAPFEERGVNWQEVYETYRPRVNVHTSEDELIGLLTEMIKILDDGHVTLTVPNRSIIHSNKYFREKIEDDLFQLEKAVAYLESSYKRGKDDSYVWGKIKGHEIGYIYLDYVGDNFFQLKDFFEKFENFQGMIIDLRHNQGGDFTFCLSEIGRIVDKSRLVFQSKTKNGPKENDYTPWHSWYVHSSGKYINKPIIVLTDRYTISAGERSVMAFKELPTVTIVGDTTNGAHGTMIGRELPNGWFFSLVPQKVLMVDGKSYEGIGIAPDVYVKNDISALNAGIDQTLEKAMELISN